MKRKLPFAVLALTLCACSGVGTVQSDGSARSLAQLENEFQQPPRAARPYLWWHWMNGNITKDGIRKDLLWHEHHPGHRYPSRDNVVLYLLTPLEGDDAIELHCGIWDPDTDEQTKEDRQSAFEYMQSIMLDPEIYEIEGAPVYSTPASDEGAAKPEETAV